MGAIYYLTKEDPKEKFELGKSNWAAIFDYEEQILTDRYPHNFDLFVEILRYIAPHFDPKMSIGYFKELSEDIFRWCKNAAIKLQIDCSFDDSNEYKQTGSRYFDDSGDTTLREAIENELNQQVVILGSNSSNVYGLTFNSLCEMEYFICDVGDFANTNRVAVVSKDLFKIHCDFIHPGGDLFVTGYFGNCEVDDVQWKRQKFWNKEH